MIISDVPLPGEFRWVVCEKMPYDAFACCKQDEHNADETRDSNTQQMGFRYARIRSITSQATFSHHTADLTVVNFSTARLKRKVRIVGIIHAICCSDIGRWR